MGKLAHRGALAGAVAVLAMGGSAYGATLTFDELSAPVNFRDVNQAYGDNVGPSFADGAGTYGSADGATPNVVVDYGPAAADAALFTTGYGDLSNVLFKDAEGFGTLDVTFTADAGYHVRLHSFDMAATFLDSTINYVRVLDSDGNELFRRDNALIPRVGHISFAFATPLADDRLTIQFDSGNLGHRSDNVALDNITFSQVAVAVPVPAAVWGALPLLAVVAGRRAMRSRRT